MRNFGNSVNLYYVNICTRNEISNDLLFGGRVLCTLSYSRADYIEKSLNFNIILVASPLASSRGFALIGNVKKIRQNS